MTEKNDQTTDSTTEEEEENTFKNGVNADSNSGVEQGAVNVHQENRKYGRQ